MSDKTTIRSYIAAALRDSRLVDEAVRSTTPVPRDVMSFALNRAPIPRLVEVMKQGLNDWYQWVVSDNWIAVNPCAKQGDFMPHLTFTISDTPPAHKCRRRLDFFINYEPHSSMQVGSLWQRKDSSQDEAAVFIKDDMVFESFVLLEALKKYSPSFRQSLPFIVRLDGVGGIDIANKGKDTEYVQYLSHMMLMGAFHIKRESKLAETLLIDFAKDNAVVSYENLPCAIRSVRSPDGEPVFVTRRKENEYILRVSGDPVIQPPRKIASASFWDML